MATDSNNRILADKYKAGGEFHKSLQVFSRQDKSNENVFSESNSEEDNNDYESNIKNTIENYDCSKNLRSKKTGKSKVILLISIIAILLLAGFKNPSKMEAQTEIKAMITEHFQEIMHHEATDKNNSAGERLGSILAVFIAPTFIDNFIQVDVSNYLILSTYDANILLTDGNISLVSGIIIFGTIIPLSSDIK